MRIENSLQKVPNLYAEGGKWDELGKGVTNWGPSVRHSHGPWDDLV